LAFKYKFHKDRINNAQIKVLVEKIISEVYGSPLAIQAIIDETLEITTNDLVAPVGEDKKESEKEMEKEDKKEKSDETGPNMLDNLLKTFGGKVVK
jgi:acyl-coenzyme A synthetase/AMP-(fatty) acid ligase